MSREKNRRSPAVPKLIRFSFFLLQNLFKKERKQWGVLPESFVMMQKGVYLYICVEELDNEAVKARD